MAFDGIRMEWADQEEIGGIERSTNMSVNLTFATGSSNGVSNGTAYAVPASAPVPAASEKRIDQHPASTPAVVSFSVGQSLADIEREMIVKTMQATRGNRTRAAKMLGISVRTLYTKLLKIESESAPANSAAAPAAPVAAHQRSA
jgi:DNA-binding NtrC family response regulator